MQEKKERTGSVEKCSNHNLPKENYWRGGVECSKCIEEIKYKELITSLLRDFEARLPERMKRMSFEKYDPTNTKAEKILEECKAYSKKLSGSLIMLGSIGTGKTHLAVSIARESIKLLKEPRITTLTEMIRHIRSTWNSKLKDDYGCAITEDAVLELYEDADLLVIDEICSQYGSDNEKVIITELINRRYNQMLPTIIIGNITLSDATSYLGSRVIDRLKEDGQILIFDWDSHRKLKG